MKIKFLRLYKKVLLIGLLSATSINLAGCANTLNLLDSKSSKIPEKIYKKVTPVKYNDGGIWPGDTARNLLFEDTKARQIGDLVTVVLNEISASTQTATTDTSNSGSLGLSTSGVLGLPSDMGIKNFLGMGTPFNPAASATNERSKQGAGTTTRSGTLTGTLSATIIAINASGNFHIEGKRSVTINNEEQLMVLTGIIRPSDVNYNNTINSSLIADASITYSGEGVIADEQRSGWMMRILSVVWPF